MRRQSHIFGIWLTVGVTTVCCCNYFILLIRLSKSSPPSLSKKVVSTAEPSLASIGNSTSDNLTIIYDNLLEPIVNNFTAKGTIPRKEAPLSTVDAVQEKVWSRLNNSKCGIHIFQPNQKAQSLILIGERHSGTTFLAAHLKECFPGIEVSDRFVNGKHWWQPTPKYVVETASKFDKEELLVRGDDVASLWNNIATNRGNPPKDYFKTALVLAVFRNPYDWVEAMRRKPWHWPNHVDLHPAGNMTANQTLHITQAVYLDPKGGATEGRSMGGRFTGGTLSVTKSLVSHRLLEWEEFVARPLSLVGYNESLTSLVCQKGYPRNLISPCQQNTTFVPDSVKSIPRSFLRHLPFALNDPVYEHDIDGKPFDNLLQLRAWKVRNFLSIPESWNLHGFGVVQYDSLLGNAFEILKEQIATALQSNSSCAALPSFQKEPYHVSEKFRDFIAKNADWEIEKSIGFHV